jgi:hypothetical protein
MCFSATASFTAAGILSIISLLSIKEVIKKPRFIMLALVPVLFAIQQFAEGIIWKFPGSWLAGLAPYIFYLIAVGIWPFWVPMSLWILEKNKRHASLLLIFSVLGALYIFLTVAKLWHGINAQTIHHHITYTFNNSIELPVSSYFFLTIGSCFESTLRYMKLFATALLISCIASYYFWYIAFGSVWCFFAAILSVGIWFIIKKN